MEPNREKRRKMAETEKPTKQRNTRKISEHIGIGSGALLHGIEASELVTFMDIILDYMAESSAVSINWVRNIMNHVVIL